MFRPTISAVGRNGTGVHHITSLNADNYSSIIQAGASGSNPIHYSAYSQRDNAIAFSHCKDATVSSGILNHARNILRSNTTSFSNSFGFKIENFLLTSNDSTIVQLDEEYIVQNVGAGTTTSGKRYRHIGATNGVATAYIMGLYAGGVVIGNTTAVPNSSASLDLADTTKGFLKNRLTSAQIASISTPAQGLEAFDTDLRNTVFLPVASGNPIRTSGTMFTQTANKQVQNTVTETSLVGTGVGSATIKANSSGIGTTYRLSMCGFISNTGAPFAQVKVKIGSVTVFDTTSTGMFGITSNQPFKVNAVFTVRTLGASGTVIGQGEFEYATSASTQYQIMFQANTATSTIDTTADQTIDITFTWGTANVSNSINSTNFTLERL